jgi:hypothetical protein
LTIQKEDPVTKFSTKLHHLIKDVKKAAKKAKTFETQKTVKRLKALRKDDASSNHEPQISAEALEKQLETLKGMDHESIGLSALRSKFNSDKTFSKDPGIVAAISSSLGKAYSSEDSSDPAKQVRNRLLSSKTLASEIKRVVIELRAVLLPKPDPATNTTDTDLSPRKKLKPSEDVAKGSSRTLDPSSFDSPDARDSETIDIPEVPPSNAGSDDWESGSVHGDSSESETDEDEDSDEDSEALKTERSAPKSGATSSSTFLPSLSVGYIRGDSSEPDFSDADMSDLVETRKNRRGQRARRAIWEKKFGKNANHVKKGSSRDQISPRAGAKSRSTNGGRSNNIGNNKPPLSFKPSDSRQQNSHSTSEASQQKLHPSWEAKRKLKEKQSVGIVPSQGKKITFS